MTEEKNSNNNEDKAKQIDSLRETIKTAEKTIQNAKSMLLQLEGKKKAGRKRKFDSDDEEGNIVQGTFDGQVMLGTDGKQYPVPANYASKSKLVEGDMLKLTITPDGSFVYKQIGPVARRNIIGIATQDEKGNYYVIAEGKPYKILLASVTYFQVEPGDEVVIVTPKDIESSWASIENVLKKAGDSDEIPTIDFSAQAKNQTNETSEKDDEKRAPEEESEESENEDNKQKVSNQDIYDDWASDIEEITRTIQGGESDQKEEK